MAGTRRLRSWRLSRLMSRERVSDPFRQVFDQALVDAYEQLVSAPGDLAAKVRSVTLYHLVLEATLGLTTFKFASEFLKREGLLPGSSSVIRRSTTTRRATSDYRRLRSHFALRATAQAACWA
jgi:hypothetical protein